MTEIFATIWRFEVARIGDQPVLVSQCVIALTMLFVGVWFARRASRVIAGRLARLPGVKPNAVAAIEKLVFYGLVLVVAAVALQTVSIPVSAFAVLGGAFAIGLGFGAQTLFNNFISGLILILEQPIRVGDVIEIDGVRGRVEDVGARCTRIRRADGVDLLVPNSHLLENKVVNWTLGDTRMRTEVKVGVAYGSDVRKVAEILEASVRACPSALQDVAPIIVFEDFGADALLFAVEFWVEVEDDVDDDVWARSDVRFAIEARCRAAGIEIAFPQRD
ncbi:MAG: mechanosensitive ion channel family protein, partial [Candidatus Binatia bacterium]